MDRKETASTDCVLGLTGGFILLLLFVCVATSPMTLASGGWALNASVSTDCAECDNVNVPVYLPGANRLWIVATHPSYCPCPYDGCPVASCTCSSSLGGKADDCTPVWDNHVDAAIWVCSVAGWWRGRTMDVVADGVRHPGHYLQYYRKIEGEELWPQFLVLYEDGNLRLKPHPPAGIDDVCFGSSVVVGPASQGERPYADIVEVNVNTTDGSLDLTYAAGGTAHVNLCVDRKQAYAEVLINYSTNEVTPVATFRSMYVAPNNCDAERVQAAGGEFPILDSWTRLDGTWWQFRRETVSQHNQSAPDILICADTAATFRVERESGAVLSDSDYYGSQFITGQSDIAEWVSVTEPVEPGDVLELDPEHPGAYRKSRGADSALVAGIVSTSPGVILGQKGAPSSIALLALAGIVPVKAIDEGGPIEPGDFLIPSSTPGVAMRWEPSAEAPPVLIGKALGSLASGSGVLLVLLTAH